MNKRRVFAWAAIILLGGMYLACLILALIGSDTAKFLLKATIVLTMVVPLILYGFLVITKANKKSAQPSVRNEEDKPLPDRIRLIAADLDGTLLNSKKEFTPRCISAISRAAGDGAVFVPATGRSLKVIPDYIKGRDFVRYIIALNGAQVLDNATGEVISEKLIDNAKAVAIMERLQQLPVIWECCYDNQNRMDGEHKKKIDEFALNSDTRTMLMRERMPVAGLLQAVREYGGPVQKVQFYFADPGMKQYYIDLIKSEFPDVSVVSSIVNNVEITHKNANKGDALMLLCEHTGIAPEETAAFGDDINDISMLRAAKLGVAMGNACEEAKQAADIVTSSCDEDGVALVIEKLFFKGEDEAEKA